MSEQIEPGDGWRLLGPEEQVKFADEFLSNATGCWHPMIKDLYGWKANCFIAARRRIPAKPEPIKLRHTLIKCNSFNDVMRATNQDVSLLVSSVAEARKLADWLNLYADWREAQEASK